METRIQYVKSNPRFKFNHKTNNRRQEHNECKKNVEWKFILIIYHENINKNERNKVMVQDMLNTLKIMKGTYL
jgi:hypothetical protein